MAIIQHTALITARLAQQYRDSENLVAYIAAMLRVADELEHKYAELAEFLDIETATGVHLDAVGAIVGQQRNFIPAAIADDEFTFDVGPGFNVGYFRAAADGFVQLSDTDYRKWIRARIVANKNAITPEDIIESVQFIFGEDVEVFFTDGDTQYTVSIGAQLSLTDLYLLEQTDILPRTAAVNGDFGVAFNAASFRFDVGPGFDVGLFSTTI